MHTPCARRLDLSLCGRVAGAAGARAEGVPGCKCVLPMRLCTCTSRSWLPNCYGSRATRLQSWVAGCGRKGADETYISVLFGSRILLENAPASAIPPHFLLGLAPIGAWRARAAHARAGRLQHSSSRHRPSVRPAHGKRARRPKVISGPFAIRKSRHERLKAYGQRATRL